MVSQQSLMKLASLITRRTQFTYISLGIPLQGQFSLIQGIMPNRFSNDRVEQRSEDLDDTYMDNTDYMKY